MQLLDCRMARLSWQPTQCRSSSGVSSRTRIFRDFTIKMDEDGSIIGEFSQPRAGKWKKAGLPSRSERKAGGQSQFRQLTAHQPQKRCQGR